MATKKFTPSFLQLLSRKSAAFLVLASIDLSAQVQISSAYSLPRAHPDCGFQEDCSLAFRIPHVGALLLCPIRSLFRIVGSSSSMDGGVLVPQLLVSDIVSHGAMGVMERSTYLRVTMVLRKTPKIDHSVSKI